MLFVTNASSDMVWTGPRSILVLPSKFSRMSENTCATVSGIGSSWFDSCWRPRSIRILVREGCEIRFNTTRSLPPIRRASFLALKEKYSIKRPQILIYFMKCLVNMSSLKNWSNNKLNIPLFWLTTTSFFWSYFTVNSNLGKFTKANCFSFSEFGLNFFLVTTGDSMVSDNRFRFRT